MIAASWIERPRAVLLVHRGILSIAALALAVRFAAFALQGPTALDWDAANYARIAQNLHDGLGNVTLRGVSNVLHAPLYPLFMALLLFIVRSPVVAGVSLSIASGTLLVVFVYRFTDAIAGARAALAAGVLAALHPSLIDASIVPLSESLFLALAFAGLDTLIRALQRHFVPGLALAGLCFGGAYVTREEGLAYVVLAVIAAIVVALHVRASLRTIAVQLAVLTVPFMLCAAPYVAFLSHETGHLSLEAKSVSNFGIALPMSRGSTYVAAADAIGPHLEDVGVEMGPSYPFSGARVPIPSVHDRIQLALQAGPHHIADLGRILGAKRNGSPLFLVLALIGAVSQLRSRSSGYGLILMGALLAEFAALLSVYHFWDRYADPFAALLLPWTACGIVLIARWIRRRSAGIPAARLAVATSTLAVIVSIVWYMSTVTELRDNAVDPVLFRNAGAWIATHGPSNAVVMAVDPLTAYYGDGIWRTLPDTNAPTALRYIASRAPAYVVVGTLFADRPYLPAWVLHGVPDPAARQVFEERSGKNVIRVYRWSPRAGNGSVMAIPTR